MADVDVEEEVWSSCVRLCCAEVEQLIADGALAQIEDWLFQMGLQWVFRWYVMSIKRVLARRPAAADGVARGFVSASASAPALRGGGPDLFLF